MRRLDLAIAILLIVMSSPLLIRGLGEPPKASLKLTVVQGDSRLEFPLGEGISWVRRFEDGKGGYNVLEVEGTRARMREANCPDRLCVQMGWIERPGQSIVCLPHRLLLRIEGGEEKLDGVSR